MRLVASSQEIPESYQGVHESNRKMLVPKRMSCERSPRYAHGPPHARHMASRPGPKMARSVRKLVEDPAPLSATRKLERGSGDNGPPPSPMQHKKPAAAFERLEVSRQQIGLHSAVSAPCLRCTTRADGAHHDRRRLSGVSRVSSGRRNARTATGKSRETMGSLWGGHTPPYFRI